MDNLFKDAKQNKYSTVQGSFGDMTMRMYVMLKFNGDIVQAIEDRYNILNQSGVVDQWYVTQKQRGRFEPHITLMEIHINLPLFFDFYNIQYFRKHGKSSRSELKKDARFIAFQREFNGMVEKYFSMFLEGEQLGDAKRIGLTGEGLSDRERRMLTSNGANYNLLGKKETNPFFVKLFHPLEPRSGEQGYIPYITQFRTAVYRYLQDYIDRNIIAGKRNFKIIQEGDYHYYINTVNHMRVYAVPSHSFGIGIWKPHCSIARIVHDGFDKQNNEENAQLVSHLLGIIRESKTKRTNWVNVTIGKETELELSYN